MSKLFPDKQTFVDLKDGNQYSLTKVTINDATTNNVEMDGVEDAAFLHDDKTTVDPAFYLTAAGGVHIDGATVGSKYTIVARHGNTINYTKAGS